MVLFDLQVYQRSLTMDPHNLNKFICINTHFAIISSSCKVGGWGVGVGGLAERDKMFSISAVFVMTLAVNKRLTPNL